MTFAGQNSEAIGRLQCYSSAILAPTIWLPYDCRQLLHKDNVIADPIDESQDNRLLALDAALSRLLVDQPTIGQLVSLRYFGGLTNDQAANALKISTRTAKRHWTYAKAWLRREIDNHDFEDDK